MIGRKITLLKSVFADKGVWSRNAPFQNGGTWVAVFQEMEKSNGAGKILPQSHEEESDYQTQDSGTPMLGFLESLHQAIDEGSEPQKPFQESSEHYRADNASVDDLWAVLVSWCV